MNLKKANLKEENNIFISKNHISIESEEIEISSRLINQNFPNYASVIPTDNDKRVRIDRDSLYSSVKRVSIFSNRSTNQLNMNFKENKVTIWEEWADENGVKLVRIRYDHDINKIIDDELMNY